MPWFFRFSVFKLENCSNPTRLLISFSGVASLLLSKWKSISVTAFASSGVISPSPSLSIEGCKARSWRFKLESSKVMGCLLGFCLTVTGHFSSRRWPLVFTTAITLALPTPTAWTSVLSCIRLTGEAIFSASVIHKTSASWGTPVIVTVAFSPTVSVSSLGFSCNFNGWTVSSLSLHAASKKVSNVAKTTHVRLFFIISWRISINNVGWDTRG